MIFEDFLFLLLNKINIKKIKKRKKILFIAFLVIICLPVSGYLALKSSRVQTYLIKKIANQASDNLNAKFTFDEIDISFFNKIILKNVYIEDQKKDTLLFSKTLIANITKFSNSNRIINLSKITLKNAFINFNTDSSNIINLKFIVNELERKDTTKKKFSISFKKVNIINSRFRFKKHKYIKKIDKFDFADLELTDLNAKFTDLIPGDTFVFNIDHLSFKERNGLQISKLNSRTSIYKKHILLDDITIRTPNTYLKAHHLYFKFRSFKDFKNFETNVRLNFQFSSANISFIDIAYFVPKLRGINRNAVLSGKITGRINDFKGKNIHLLVGKQTELSGSFDINGLPEVDKTYMFINLKNLTTTAEDIENLPLPPTSKEIKLPRKIKNLGIMNYKGNFIGFLNDFVAYGKLNTELGDVSSDLSIRPDKNKNLNFKGDIKTKKFNLGMLLGNSKHFNSLTMNVNVNGSYSQSEDIEATLEGIINNIKVNEYNYKNLFLAGDLTHKKFDGLISIDDPNIKFQFLGRFDFSEEIPVFDFSSTLQHASLHKLNFNKDTSATLSLSLLANFTGNNIDNLNGKIQFNNTTCSKFNDSLHINNFVLVANSDKNIKQISLQSDYIDGEIFGKYKYTSLFSSIKNITYNYLPALKTNDSLNNIIDTLNNFTFNINFKKTQDITNFFIPELKISDNSHFSGKYDASIYDISFDGFAKDIVYKNNRIHNFQLKASSNQNNFILTVEGNRIKANKYLDVSNFTLNSVCMNDSINTNLYWESLENESNSNFKAITYFYKNPSTKYYSTNIKVIPSNVVINNEKWVINECTINIDTSFIGINKFKISNKDQLFSIDGAISKNLSDKLNFVFKNLNITQFNILSNNNNTIFYGVLSGYATLGDLYTNPVYFSDLNISNLSINKNNIGNANISSIWDNKNKLIRFQSNIQKNSIKSFDANGNYTPDNKKLDCSIKLDDFHLSVFQPFLKNTFSTINGFANGELKISGSSQKPVLKGKIKLDKTEVELAYLKTTYTFETEIPVTDNSFIFDNVNLSDINGNNAILNGSINHQNLKNIEFNLNLNANNFQSLNTTEKDNSMFYGTAFTSGITQVIGSTKNLKINIAAETEDKTQIFIPLTDDEEVIESDFITFVNTKSSDDFEFEEDEYDVDLSGIELKFDLEVTPEAEAQLIFDSKIGDIIKGRGAGNLKLEIKTTGDFKMYGDLIFEEGNYLFTLQNVINKKFEVKPGGIISWNGDPYDAIINTEAVYKLKTSIYDLLVDAEERHRKRIPVECQLFMTDKLMNPTLKFNISVPTADTETQTLLRNAINTEEILKKQFISLLVINSFMPDPNRYGGGPTENKSTGSVGKTSAAVTTSELLSNQLSNWLSQISNDFDIGINYRPGDEVTSNEVELALSTQVLNDRVSINGNVDVAGRDKETNTNNIVGDFNVDVKINKSGKLRLKAFTRANDKLMYEEAPNTQGVGILYREDFNTFKELFVKYWDTLFKKEQK